MEYKYVIGVDPGETTGIVRIEYQLVGTPAPSSAFWHPTGERVVIQCDHKSVRSILAWLAAVGNVIISHERYVVGLRASRVKKAAASQITRDLNGFIEGLAEAGRVRIVAHTASETKPWATAEKMVAAGIKLAPEMRHAADGAKQALYAATHDLGAPDPLSKRVQIAAAYGALTVEQTGLYSYGVKVTGVLGPDGKMHPPETDTEITFDTEPVDSARLLGQQVTSGTITGRLSENPPPIMGWHAASGHQLWSDDDAAGAAGEVPYQFGGKPWTGDNRYIGLTNSAPTLEEKE